MHFGIPLNSEIAKLSPDLHRNEINDAICGMIDQQILTGYKLWKNNYIAYDLFQDRTPDYQHYSKTEREKFIDDVEHKASLIDGEQEALKMLFYEVNARPVINHMEFAEKSNKN